MNVFVGLSGGVDSAVSAALLKKSGAQVTGVFIKGWYPPGMPCTWASDRRDAMRVAARLAIPFYTLDASTEYKKGVIDYLLTEYASGRTPNPDAMCNREVKFGVFYDFARKYNADFIATGHYAQINTAKNGEFTSQLLRGQDTTKDQSYFLWAIPKDVLAHTLFPVGAIDKSEVRSLAKKFSLPVATKKDSQGICFLGSISVDEFLRKKLLPEAGKAVDEEGKELGVHDGAVLYTLGERIALRNASPGPWYVLKKDMKANVITVSHSPVSTGPHGPLCLEHSNWFEQIPSTESVTAQYRYHGPSIVGKLSIKDSTFTPDTSLTESVAKGQSLVIYRGNVCIGGGSIG